jgi:hypothetical protein
MPWTRKSTSRIETDFRGDHSYGAHLAIGFAAADVRAAVIEDSSHWIR